MHNSNLHIWMLIWIHAVCSGISSNHRPQHLISLISFSSLIRSTLVKWNGEAMFCVRQEPVHSFLVVFYLTVCRVNKNNTVQLTRSEILIGHESNLKVSVFQNALESRPPKILRNNNSPAGWFSHHSALPVLHWKKKHCIRHGRGKQ